MNSQIKITDTVGNIATEFPLATRVFARYQIDFCCGGGLPLGELCDRLELDPNAILAEIEGELSEDDGDSVRWDEVEPEILIDHILTAYHEPLKEELPRLESMAAKVADVHGDGYPETLPPLLSVFRELEAELLQHMEKEERVLFPMIKNGQGEMAAGPVACMEDEHRSAGDALSEIRRLTNDFRVPEEACTTWRALWHGLAALETAMHRHIHLENNILFPRALHGPTS